MKAIAIATIVIVLGAVVGVWAIFSSHGDAQAQENAPDAAAGAPQVKPAQPTAAPSPQPMPQQLPPYQRGEYKGMIATGDMLVQMPDGGVMRIHDGLDRPCDVGCTFIYQNVIGRISRERSGGVGDDGPKIIQEAFDCMAACASHGADKIMWPPVE